MCKTLRAWVDWWEPFGWNVTPPADSRSRFYQVAVFRIELVETVGADPVADFGVRVFLDVRLDLTPIPVVIANILAARAERQQAAEGLDLADRFFNSP